MVIRASIQSTNLSMASSSTSNLLFAAAVNENLTKANHIMWKA
jgi:hypothetical protein